MTDTIEVPVPEEGVTEGEVRQAVIKGLEDHRTHLEVAAEVSDNPNDQDAVDTMDEIIEQVKTGED